MLGGWGLLPKGCLKFFVATDAARYGDFHAVAQYTLVAGVNQTSYERGHDHRWNGALAQLLNNGTARPNVTEDAIIAYAIHKTPARAKIIIPNNPLIQRISDGIVASAIGEHGSRAQIHESYDAGRVKEAITIISEAMAENGHFRFYDGQFMMIGEAAARFPDPGVASFVPVTSAMRANMPLLHPQQVLDEIDYILAYKNRCPENDRQKPKD